MNWDQQYKLLRIQSLFEMTIDYPLPASDQAYQASEKMKLISPTTFSHPSQIIEINKLAIVKTIKTYATLDDSSESLNTDYSPKHSPVKKQKTSLELSFVWLLGSGRWLFVKGNSAEVALSLQTDISRAPSLGYASSLRRESGVVMELMQ